MASDASAAGILTDDVTHQSCALVLRDDAGPHAGTAHCYHLSRQLEFILDPWSPSSFLMFRWLFDSAWERGK